MSFKFLDLPLGLLLIILAVLVRSQSKVASVSYESNINQKLILPCGSLSRVLSTTLYRRKKNCAGANGVALFKQYRKREMNYHELSTH